MSRKRARKPSKQEQRMIRNVRRALGVFEGKTMKPDMTPAQVIAGVKDTVEMAVVASLWDREVET